ncbi:MAG: hypothetical protein M3503_06030, partial [Actinomycetota bacterium]|nr:hypothetical protein [Actinomycetota bacterium]
VYSVERWSSLNRSQQLAQVEAMIVGIHHRILRSTGVRFCRQRPPLAFASEDNCHPFAPG